MGYRLPTKKGTVWNFQTSGFHNDLHSYLWPRYLPMLSPGIYSIFYMILPFLVHSLEMTNPPAFQYQSKKVQHSNASTINNTLLHLSIILLLCKNLMTQILSLIWKSASSFLCCVKFHDHKSCDTNVISKSRAREFLENWVYKALIQQQRHCAVVSWYHVILNITIFH